MSARPEVVGGLSALSARERVVAERYALGLTHREIGEALFIAPATVRTHLANIFVKLDVHNRTALAMRIGATHPARSIANDSGPPVIAVVPFDPIAADPRSARFADGLHTDLIIDLARHPDLRVVARQTMLAYRGRPMDLRTVAREVGASFVLEGTIQRDDRRIRATTQLIGAGSGATVWSARYDRPDDEVFEAQDEIVRSIVNTIASCSGQLSLLGREVARRKPPASLTAYDLYLLGVERKHGFTAAGNAEGIELLTRAVELDPAYSPAWVALGLAHSVAVCNGFTKQPAVAARHWRECIERALALDPHDSLAHVSMGDVRAHDGDLKGAAVSYEQALRTGPHNADTLAMLAGSFSLVIGDPRLALDLAREAIRLNPGAPMWYYSMLGRAAFVAGETEQAIAAFRRAPRDSPHILMLQALAHARLKEVREAQALLGRLEREFRSFGLDVLIRQYPVTNPPALAAVRADAEKLGLPLPRSLAC